MADQISTQGDRSVVVGRDVINSIINTGDHNQFFIGDYERLRDAYIEPWSVFERVNLDRFVGREWLLDEVDDFLRDHDRGYFILEAEAGLGKTTFLAWLVRERGYIHHFTELAPGLEGVGRGLKNLAAQLVLAYQLSAYEAEGVLPGAAARPDYLSRLLRQAAGQRQDGEKIVLVVDALDEAGTPYGQNVLGLPQVLPEGVFVIVSQRPVAVTLQVDTATTSRLCFPLAADSDDNRDDMRRFLKRAATWPGIAQALQESGYTSEQFTTTLQEKCQGVWIYLHYVIHEIERGERSPLDLGALPDGMTQYYARYWGRWRDEDEGEWHEVYLPVLATLAAAQEAVTAERLIEWTGIDLSAQKLQRLLSGPWRPFLAIAGHGQQTHYRFYHATLHEFFGGQVKREKLTKTEGLLLDELAEATHVTHHHLAERYLETWDGLEAGLSGLWDSEKRNLDEGYGLRHLATHLEAADRIADLHRLLQLEWEYIDEKPFIRRGLLGWLDRTRKLRRSHRHHRYKNAWSVVKEEIRDIEGYLTDVKRAWRLAERAYCHTAEEKDESIALQCRYALMIASVNTLSSNLPPVLLAALVEHGIWSAGQGLVYARQVPDLGQRSQSLARLSPYLPEMSRESVLREALGLARTLPEKEKYTSKRLRLQALMEIVPRLADLGHWQEALAIAQEVEDSSERVEMLLALAPHLPESPLREVLATIQEIQVPYVRFRALMRLIPHLPASLKEETLDEMFNIWRSTDDAIAPAQVIEAVAPDLPRRLVWKLLEIIWKSNPLVSSKADALAALAPYLPEPGRTELLEQALLEMRPEFWSDAPLWSKKKSFRALAVLASLIPISKRTNVLREALAWGRGILDIHWWKLILISCSNISIID